MFTLRFILRNAFRHRLRTGLTILGIAVTILAFGMLRTVVAVWYSGSEAAAADRLVTRNAISLISPLPIAYRERIRQVPGVKAIAAANWFGGVFVEEKNFFPNFAVQVGPYLAMYPEFVLEADQKAAFLRDRKGAVVGRKTMARFGWRLGDTITLKGTIFQGNWDMTIRAVYTGAHKNTDETLLLFHWDYLNESVKKTTPARADQTGIYVVQIADPSRAAEVSAAIDSLFKNSMAETLTETEKAFQLGFIAMSQAIVAVIQIVSVVVIVIIMAVMANTMAMTARERIGEYAVLKTFGFGGGYIGLLVFGESLAISLAGCVVGVALTPPAAHAFGRALSDFFPFFNVDPETYGYDLAIGLVVGGVAAVFPTWRASRIRIADALRRVG